MYTVIETPVYSNKVSGILTEDERDAFAAFIATNPTADPLFEARVVFGKYDGLRRAVARVAVRE